MTIQTFVVSMTGVFGREKKKTFIQQACIKMIKSDIKNIYNITKDFYFK